MGESAASTESHLLKVGSPSLEGKALGCLLFARVLPPTVNLPRSRRGRHPMARWEGSEMEPGLSRYPANLVLYSGCKRRDWLPENLKFMDGHVGMGGPSRAAIGRECVGIGRVVEACSQWIGWRIDVRRCGQAGASPRPMPSEPPVSMPMPPRSGPCLLAQPMGDQGTRRLATGEKWRNGIERGKRKCCICQCMASALI